MGSEKKNMEMMNRSGISEMLEIVFHYMLFMKKIYPERLFEKRIKYNLPIWKCKSQAICSYIRNFLMLLEKFLGKEPSLDVAFVVIGRSRQPLEEFVFEIQYPKEVPKDKPAPKFIIGELLASIAIALSSVGFSKSNCHGSSFQLQLRSNCTVVTPEDIKDDLKNKDFPWRTVKNPNAELWNKMTPLQTVDNSRFKVQIYQFRRIKCKRKEKEKEVEVVAEVIDISG